MKEEKKCKFCDGTGVYRYFVEHGNWGTNGPDYSDFEGWQEDVCSCCKGSCIASEGEEEKPNKAK